MSRNCTSGTFPECSESVPHGTISEHFIWTLVKCSKSVPHGTLSEHVIWTLVKCFESIPQENFPNTAFEHLSNVLKVYRNTLRTLKPMIGKRVHGIYAYVIGLQPIDISFNNFRPVKRSIHMLWLGIFYLRIPFIHKPCVNTT